jgi:hypothetical protein
MHIYVPTIIEKVYNIQGSTAAPGSGEYHRYRALRRKERTIAAALEKEYKLREDQKEFENKLKKKQEKDKEITLKKKRKRDKKKLNKKNKKNGNNIILNNEEKNKNEEEENNNIINILNEEKIINNDNNNINNDNGNFSLKPNTLIYNNDIKEQNEFENEQINILQKIFPKKDINQKEFETYEDYENYCAEQNVLERNKRKEEEKNKLKIKQIDDIICHDED